MSNAETAATPEAPGKVSNQPGLIVQKIGMTRMVDGGGKMIPVTLLKVAEQKVTKVLTEERDGYSAVQVGYFPKREKLLNKPELGRLRNAGIDDNFSRFRELRYAPGETPNGDVGSTLAVDVIKDAAKIDATGVTKGKGFKGAITRWGFATGRKTHGSHFYRRTGSLGMRTTPGRVFKNKKMPGHMGTARRTIQGLQVVSYDAEDQVLAIKGSVPGHQGGYLLVRPSKK